MSVASFKVTKEESQLIAKIAHRAQSFFNAQNIDQSILDTTMDISACVANGNPLRLQELLSADDFNFMHDVGGIYRHINRDTGKLENCFSPRFSEPFFQRLSDHRDS